MLNLNFMFFFFLGLGTTCSTDCSSKMLALDKGAIDHLRNLSQVTWTAKELISIITSCLRHRSLELDNLPKQIGSHHQYFSPFLMLQVQFSGCFISVHYGKGIFFLGFCSKSISCRTPTCTVLCFLLSFPFLSIDSLGFFFSFVKCGLFCK